jgi:hypothetical protein
MRTTARVRQRFFQRIGALAGVAPRTLQRFHQPLAADRLDQVIHRARLEGGERVLVVRGAEHHRGRGIETAQVMRGFESVEQRHRDVEQHHVGAFGIGDLAGFAAIGGFADDFVPADVVEQVAQALARQRFVIGDQDAHLSPPRTACRATTTAPRFPPR